MTVRLDRMPTHDELIDKKFRKRIGIKMEFRHIMHICPTCKKPEVRPIIVYVTPGIGRIPIYYHVEGKDQVVRVDISRFIKVY